MKWQEVRELYPNQFVKLKILQSHIDGNKKIIEDIAVIKSFDNNRDATRELVRAKEDELVYHTTNEEITLEICNIRGYGGNVTMKKFDFSKISDKLGTPISSMEALKDVTLFEWSEEVLRGEKRILVCGTDRKSMTKIKD